MITGNVTVNVGFNTKMAVEEILEYVARAGPGGSDACARSRLRAPRRAKSESSFEVSVSKLVPRFSFLLDFSNSTVSVVGRRPPCSLSLART